jgi:hypothetical protein
LTIDIVTRERQKLGYPLVGTPGRTDAERRPARNARIVSGATMSHCTIVKRVSMSIKCGTELMMFLAPTASVVKLQESIAPKTAYLNSNEPVGEDVVANMRS